VFANDGKASITNLYLPDPAKTGLEFFSEGGHIRFTSMEVNQPESIWQERDLQLGYHPQYARLSFTHPR
jgi:hypothetical protein